MDQTSNYLSTNLISLLVNFSDLTQTLQALQERVNTLERNLMPFTVPYPTVPAFNPYGTHIPNTHGKQEQQIKNLISLLK